MQIEIDCTEAARIPMTDESREYYTAFMFRDGHNAIRVNMTNRATLELFNLLTDIVKENAGLMPENIRRKIESLPR